MFRGRVRVCPEPGKSRPDANTRQAQRPPLCGRHHLIAHPESGRLVAALDHRCVGGPECSSWPTAPAHRPPSRHTPEPGPPPGRKPRPRRRARASGHRVPGRARQPSTRWRSSTGSTDGPHCAVAPAAPSAAVAPGRRPGAGSGQHRLRGPVPPPAGDASGRRRGAALGRRLTPGHRHDQAARRTGGGTHRVLWSRSRAGVLLRIRGRPCGPTVPTAPGTLIVCGASDHASLIDASLIDGCRLSWAAVTPVRTAIRAPYGPPSPCTAGRAGPGGDRLGLLRGRRCGRRSRSWSRPPARTARGCWWTMPTGWACPARGHRRPDGRRSVRAPDGGGANRDAWLHHR